MFVDVIRFKREIRNVSRTYEVEEATEVPVKVSVKDPVTGESTIETRLEPRMVKKTVTRLEQIPREYVEYAQPGMRERATCVKSIGEIRAIQDPIENEEDNEERVSEAKKRDFLLAAYEAWLKGHQLPSHGTPLGAWPAISPQMAEQFRMVGITVVEEVRDLTEATKSRCAHIGDIAGLMKQAKLFLDSADTLKTASQMQALEAQNAELQDLIQDQQAAMQQMQEMLLELKQAREADDAKPKRGRPPRVDNSEADAA